MDLDRIIGAVFGLIILLAIFILPFGYFRLPSGQTSEPILFNTVKLLVESIILGVTPANLLIFNILIIVSFVFLMLAGVLGFYPVRSGVMGIIGMILITVVSMFHPQLGFSIPSYGVGYFAAWGLSVTTFVLGKLQLQTRRKLSFLSSKAPALEKPKLPDEKATPPQNLFTPLQGEERSSEGSVAASTDLKDLFTPLLASEPDASKPVSVEKPAITPPEEIFTPLLDSKSSQPVIPLPLPPVDVSVIEEAIRRIRVFLIILEDEKSTNVISEEAYEELKRRFEVMVNELEKEKESR